MKKILLISAAVLALAACHKEPYMDSDNEYLVYTSPAKDVDFAQFRTYHVADSVLIIGNSDKSEYSKTPAAVELIDQVKSNLQKRGYTFVPTAAEADLGVQLTYMVKTEKYIHYYGDNYWWYNYPGYWPSGYWGAWRGYYYPRPVVYAYTTNALITDIVDLRAVPAADSEEKPLEILWTSYIGGSAGNAYPGAQKRMITAINQAFVQSPYLKAE